MTNEKDERPEQSDVRTPRVQTLADAAAVVAQAKEWEARKNGMQNAGPPVEVRSLKDDPEAKAQAEAAMRQMMEKRAPMGRRR